MDIATTNPAGTRATTPQPATEAARSPAISSDFNTFLKMLTVQMQNQDPLNPIDSSDYAVQLATFSGVEQQVRTNDLLTSLAAQMATSGLADMAGWVGMQARAAVPGYWDGATPVTLSPNPLAIADRVELVVKDRWGTEVSRREIPATADSYVWDGRNGSGTALPTGAYSFELVSFSQGDALQQDPVEVYSTVREIRSDGAQTILLLSGGVQTPASAVTALRDPSAI